MSIHRLALAASLTAILAIGCGHPARNGKKPADNSQDPTTESNYTMDRKISFDAIENARELGGLRTADGRTIRRGLLLRSGNLSRATDDDVERLRRSYRLTDVVDFRFPAEAEKDPDRQIPGVRYTHLSTLPQRLIDGFSQGRMEEQPSNTQFVEILIQYAGDPHAQELARQLYPAIITDPRSQEYYGRFLRTVLEAEGGVLWHCSQGKDRAGLASAFVLAALGADRETIVADFDLSNESYATAISLLSRKVQDMGGNEEALKFIGAMVGVSRENFERALDLIDAQYGSLSAYLAGLLGFGPADQQRLREKYLL